jgi:trimethylamine--corrinoid protein Co-methyltransferase
MLDMGVTFCFKQLLMDADVADMVKYSVAGVPVTDDTLSVDIIREVGQAKNFLAHKNTFIHRKMQSQPALIDRNMRGRWEERGATTMTERAETRLRHILDTHQPPELPPAVRQRIRDLVNEAEDRYGVPRSSE